MAATVMAPARLRDDQRHHHRLDVQTMTTTTTTTTTFEDAREGDMEFDMLFEPEESGRDAEAEAAEAGPRARGVRRRLGGDSVRSIVVRAEG